MDTAKLGVAIDPTAATQGARKVKQELQGIGQQAKTSLGQVDAAAAKAGTGMRTMGGNARAGFLDMTRGAMDALDAAGLLNNGFGAMLRRMDSAIRAGQQLGGIHRGLAGSTNAAAGAMNGMAGASGSLLGRLAPMIGTIALLTAGLLALIGAAVGVGIALKAIQASIPEAAKLETFQVRMAVAMGSFDKARAKFKELKQFADETPFTDTEVFEAGTALEAMTKGVLTTPAALKAIGGAASQAGVGFKEMAENVGTVYNGLMNGGDVLEYLKTMMSKGVIDGATLQAVRRLGEEAEKSGNKGGNAAKQWALVYADLEKKSVALILQSRTWNGLVSTMEGNWESVKAAFGEPIMDALKPVLVDIIKLLPQIRQVAAEAGAALGTGIRVLYQSLQQGTMGDLFVTTFMAGIETVAAAFTGRIAAEITYLGTALGNAFGQAASDLHALLSATFTVAGEWLGNSLGEAADIGANAMMKAYATFVEWLSKAINAVLVPATSAAAKLGLMSGPAIIGPTAGYKPVNFFEPGKQKSFAETYAAMKQNPIFMPVQNDFDSLRKSNLGDDLVGTTWRDKAAAYGAASNKIGQPDPELPQPTSPPKLSPTGNGTGGKEGTDKAPKAEAVRSQIDELTKAWQDLGAMMDETMASVAQSISSNMTNSLTDMIMGAKGAKQAFSEMATAIVGDIINMILKMTIQLALARALAAMGYGGAGGGAGILAGLAHTGGTVGVTNLSQAPKYHQGGQLSSEKMVRVDKGETILTRRQSADLSRELAASRSARSDGGKNQGGNATIINVLDRNEIGDAVAKNPGAVINALSRNLPAVRKMIMSGERP